MIRTHAARGLLAALAAAALACGSAGDEPAQAVGASASDDCSGGRGPLTVLTRNLYLGADLAPALAAQTQEAFLAATTGVWAMVRRNDFDLRAQGVADEIAAARPELVGLQEAYTWRYASPPGGAETVVYDYVPALLGALAARGLHYRPVASVELIDLSAPIVASTSPLAFATVRMTDHGVILARRDVPVRNPGAHVYQQLLPISVLGQPSQVPRGWASVEAKVDGRWLTFASTHLEAYSWYHRWLQAQELAASLAQLRGDVVLVGDLNSDPLDGRTVGGVPGANALAYQALAASGLGDAWLAVHTDDPGFTSPFPEDLTDEAATLSERIDHVLFRGGLAARAAAVTGAEPADRACGTTQLGVEECLWPSDHAGVRVDLRPARGEHHGWR